MSDENQTNESPEYNDQALFTQLVLSFQAAAWQQMGKVASVLSGKVERNLEMARHSIDMLAMLEEKTKGNLNEDESKYLTHVLYELRMNYLEEVKKGPDTKEEDKEEEQLKNTDKPVDSENSDNA
ncbi:MAG: DUF1844 domain-containing protein [candidate division Zixibacteria bacterium]